MSNLTEMTTIIEFLGEENQDKIRNALTDAIIENLQESLDQKWFICPDTLTEQLEDCYTKLFKKHKKEITNAMEIKILNMIEKIAKEETE
jgi:hypoxanthine phosphoribosyltransferase